MFDVRPIPLKFTGMDKGNGEMILTLDEGFG